MTILAPTAAINAHPTRWDDFKRLRHWLKVSDAFTSPKDVNRFAARYRFAQVCRVTLDGYSPNTANGYDSIVRVALSWSAAEALMAAQGLSKHEISVISARYSWNDLLVAMRASGKIAPFFRTIQAELDNKGQKALIERFLAGDECCALALAKCIRHIFFHGTLTPNAGGADAAAVAAACQVLAEGLLHVLDSEFSRGVAELQDLENAAYGSDEYAD